MVSDSKPGDITICSMCGARIEFVGPSWMHIGEPQPKHPAFPAERQTVTVDLDRLRARMARRETIALDDIDLLFGLIEDQHRQLKASQERERVATEAHRELETLYQASQERALRAEESAQALRVWHNTAAHSIERLGALVEDLRIGAEQQSQSHVDVLAKIAAFRSQWDFGEALLAELDAARTVVDAADNGEWHSSEDCEVEGRAHECALCIALATYRAKAGPS